MTRNKLLKLLIPAAVVAAAANVAQAQTVIYVDGSATGPAHDGATWCNAFTDLQEALALAGTDTEVRVADGTYTPAPPDGSRAISFPLASGVAILGGYAGCGTPDPDLRDPGFLETILSGDLNGDDKSGGDNSENSYHVVTGGGTDATAVLDGFVITAANANGPNPSDRGAGIFNFPSSSNPTLRNCVIRDNVALAKGAGMYGFRTTATLTNCTFIGNTAADGAGLYNLQSSPTVTGCTFSNNHAVGLGGGVLNLSSAPTFTDCLFIENTAAGGGGMQNVSSGSKVTNCMFVGNVAHESAHPAGGGMLNQSSNPRVSNCMFNGNTAEEIGGGMHSTLDSSPRVFNCVFAHNSAAVGGGLGSKSGDVTVTSCVFWANSDDGGMEEPAQIYVADGALTLNYSCVQGLTGSLMGMGNIGDDPMFVDPAGADNISGTHDDDLRPGWESRSIDAGDPYFLCPPGMRDLDGNDRVVCGRVDMGPYEFDSNGECPEPAVPTVSQWGLVILALLLLTAGKLFFGRRGEVAA